MWGCERLDRYGKIGCLRRSYRNDSRVAGLNQNATHRYVIDPATANTEWPVRCLLPASSMEATMTGLIPVAVAALAGVYFSIQAAKAQAPSLI